MFLCILTCVLLSSLNNVSLKSVPIILQDHLILLYSLFYCVNFSIVYLISFPLDYFQYFAVIYIFAVNNYVHISVCFTLYLRSNTLILKT